MTIPSQTRRRASMRSGHRRILLRIVHHDVVRHRRLRARLALRIVRLEDLHLDPHNALAQQHIARALLHEEVLRLPGRDQIPVLELHHLGALLAHLPGDRHLAALGAVLHDEAHHAVARAANHEAAEELEAEGLALRHGGEAAILHTLGEKLDGVLREAEALLHHSRQFTDAPAFLPEDLPGAGGTDDDLR